MPTRRTSPVTLVALAVAVLALLVAVGSTSYAAGLAHNSVGNLQLRTDAVTGSKVKDGALTGADLKDGSIGPAELSAGASAPRDVVVSRDLQDTGGSAVTLLTTPDLVLTARCDATDNDVDLVARDPDEGSALEVYGILSQFTTSGATTTQPYLNGALQVTSSATEGLRGVSIFEGTVRNGTRPWLHVSATVTVVTFPAVDYCTVRFVGTPGR